MRAALASAVILMSTLSGAMAQQVNLICKTGPVEKTYGSTKWLVYSCDDHRSLVFLAAPDSPAAPFYFFRSGGKLDGEGTGSKAATDAAFAEISNINDQGAVSLIAESVKFTSPQSPINH